jgi:hypothetical protein
VGFVDKVITGETIPEPKSWSYPEINEYAKEITPTNIEGKPFNMLGRVYSSFDEKRIDSSSASANELQKYATAMYHAFPDAMARKLPKPCDDHYPANIAFDYISGLAFISLNAIEKGNRDWAKRCLETIQEKIKKENDPDDVNNSELETMLVNMALCRKSAWAFFDKEKRYLPHFKKSKRRYMPKGELKAFDGRVLSFSTFAGMSPGITVIVDMDFDVVKERIEAYGLIFDSCDHIDNMDMKLCRKEIPGKRRSIALLRHKETESSPWVSAIMCVRPYVK